MTERIAELNTKIATLRNSVIREKAQVDTLIETAKAAAAKVQEQEALVKSLEEACAVLSRYADTRQESVRNLIETMVSQGLTEVFEEDLHFHVRTKSVGRRTDTFFTLSSKMGEEEVETDILSARGGGVAAVTGFLLRVIFILLHKAPRILFLDEAFAQVSENYEPRLAEFLDTLCTDYGLRVVLVTHSQNPVWSEVADAVYTSSMKDGVTTLTKAV